MKFNHTAHLLKMTLLLIGIGIFQSCFYDNAQDYFVNIPGSGCDTTAVSFAAKVKPILDNNCAIAGCHSGAVPAANVDLSTLSGAQTHAERSVFRVKQGTMPASGPLNACFVNTLDAWVNQGKAAN